MTDLLGSFQRYGRSVLASSPEIVHQWSKKSDSCELRIPASSPNGFDIRLEVSAHTVTLGWGRWHTPFELDAEIETFVENLFGLLRDMLSPDMRIRELWTWPFPYRGFLESFDGTRWSVEQETGLILWNYLGKRSVRIYSNSVLPGRMSMADTV
jgi:hypothetical protein